MTYFPDTSKGGLPISLLPDGGAAALSDTDIVERSGTDYRTTLAAQIVLARATAPRSRSTTLPAVLTATDNDATVVLTGSGGALTVDGTVGDGFRCCVLNRGGGNVGLPWASTISSGLSARILAAGANLFSVIVGPVGSGELTLGAPIDAITLATVL